MKAAIVQLILTAFLWISCSDSDSVDRTSLVDTGGFLLSAILEKDTNRLIPMLDKEMPAYIRLRYAEKELGIARFTGKDADVLRIDTIAANGFWANRLRVAFKVDTSYYTLDCQYYRDQSRQINISSMSIIDESGSCREWIEEPYDPFLDVQFTNLVWQSSNWNTQFDRGEVRVENGLSQPIHLLKFRLMISVDKKEVFRQTIESTLIIEAGDVRSINIPGMSGYYVGRQFSNANLTWDAVLLEVLPKPEGLHCITLKELKAL